MSNHDEQPHGFENVSCKCSPHSYNSASLTLHIDIPSGLSAPLPQNPQGDDMSTRRTLGSPINFEHERLLSSSSRMAQPPFVEFNPRQLYGRDTGADSPPLGVPASPSYQGWGESPTPRGQLELQDDFEKVKHHYGFHHAQHQDGLQEMRHQNAFQQMKHYSEAQHAYHQHGLQQVQHRQNQDLQIPADVSATQLPPMDLENPNFEDTRSAKTFLQQSVWRPKSENYGVPRSMNERLRYVKRIYDAIIDLSDVQDADMWPAEGPKFRPGTGMWAHPKDIEAISQEIVETAIKIHKVGVHGLRFQRDDGLRVFQAYDAIFTFPERIFFMAHLLRHFKLKADAVMRNSFIEEFLARIWSELMDQPTFRTTWGSMGAEQQLAQLDQHAYSDVPQKPPTRKQRSEWLRRYEADAPSVQQQEQVQEQPAESEEDVSLLPRKRRNTGGSS